MTKTDSKPKCAEVDMTTMGRRVEWRDVFKEYVAVAAGGVLEILVTEEQWDRLIVSWQSPEDEDEEFYSKCLPPRSAYTLEALEKAASLGIVRVPVLLYRRTFILVCKEDSK